MILLLILLLQTDAMQTVSGINPDALLVDRAFDISPSSVYGYLIALLLSFSIYLKGESLFNSWSHRKQAEKDRKALAEKDAYIKELFHMLLTADRESINMKEAEIWERIRASIADQQPKLPEPQKPKRLKISPARDV